MSFWGRLIPVALAAISLVAANGCSPADPSPEDEEKEPHFVLGNSRFNEMEYDGAIDAFQQALEVNPHSAQAHYRLAQLYDTKCPNPAAAIYHYQEYLRLDPQANNSEVISQRVLTCKQQLAADVMAMPTAPRTLKEIADLNQTNQFLKSEVDQLSDSVRRWSAYAATLQSEVQNNPTPPPNNYPTPPGNSPPPEELTSPTATAPRRTTTETPAAHTRTHVVVAGETFAGIARKQGVSLSALEAANPGITPKKLRAGQTLNLP